MPAPDRRSAQAQAPCAVGLLPPLGAGPPRSGSGAPLDMINELTRSAASNNSRFLTALTIVVFVVEPGAIELD